MARFEHGKLVVYDNVGFESKTVSTVAVGFASVPANDVVYYFTITVLTNPIRIRGDGTDPSATVGYKIAAGTTLTLAMNPSGLKMIRDTSASGDAIVEVLYFGVNQ